MKKLILSALLMSTVGTGLQAVTLSGDATEIDRILVLKAGVLDAMKCENTIYGDHIGEASIYRVVSSTDSGTSLFYEIVDGNDTATICDKPVTVLRGYFPSISNSRKLKKIERVMNMSGNSISCTLDGKAQITKSLKILPSFLEVYRVYGRKEFSPVLTEQEINYIITDDGGSVLAKCNQAKFVADNRNDLNPDMLDRAAFEKKKSELNSLNQEIGRKILEADYDSNSDIVEENFHLGHCKLNVSISGRWQGSSEGWYAYGSVSNVLSTMVDRKVVSKQFGGKKPDAKNQFEAIMVQLEKTYSECFVSKE